MPTHLAALISSAGQPLQIHPRPTPTPGPNELLIAIKSIALNPADAVMRNTGLFLPSHPTVIGFDFSGLVIAVGANVPTTDSAGGPCFEAGVTHVAAYAASFWRGWGPDYGAFQERCVVPWQHAVALPGGGKRLGWNEAATLPVAVQVALGAWDVLRILRIGKGHVSASDGAGFVGIDASRSRPGGINRKTDVLLIWGASSSVGTMGVQSARLLRDDRDSNIAAVYATAGAANHEYVASLGADHVFDYKDPGVVETIVSAARGDGLVIRHCFLAMGQLAQCQAVLKAFVSDDGQLEDHAAKIVSAPPIPSDTKTVEGVETVFLLPSMQEEERLAQFRYCMGTWLSQNLTNGYIRPSPELRVVGRGLEAINAGLDILAQGVSCTKIVVEIAD